MSLTPPPGTGMFWCPIDGCDRHFTMQRGLTRHLREGHGERNPMMGLDAPAAPRSVFDVAMIRELMAVFPPLDDYDYDTVDDLGVALHRALHAAYRSA